MSVVPFITPKHYSKPARPSATGETERLLSIRYPAAGSGDTLAAIGVVLSFLAGLAGASSGPRRRLPLLLGGLGLAFLW
jgi:hypothetical protein